MSSGELSSYVTLREESLYEPEKIKGSRFIACLAPTDSESAAQAFLERVRAEFSDAGHHCFAWRLGARGNEFRSSDDGEPSGSAGRPILLQLEGHEVTDATCVVARWFGGTKLGVGGLMRAYGGTAGQALDRAVLETVVVKRALRITHPYDCSGAVAGVLAAHELEGEDSHYGEVVRFTVRVALPLVAAFQAEVIDRTAGRAEIEVLA